MTKKHYEAIAAILKVNREWYNIDNNGELDMVTSQLADYFEQDNPRFQRARFLEACGIEQSQS